MTWRTKPYFAICLVLSLSIIGVCTGQRKTDNYDLLRKVILKVDGYKLGTIRSVIERDFEFDGGLQFAPNTRYVYKKCHYIKIDVEFSGKNISKRTDLLPDDRVVSVSKPYLDYPFSD